MHRSGRTGWLRAAVLGSDDAIVSTASLMIGVAAASASKQAILVAGVAGLVAGAMSMAVGEYVSVSSQRDAEQADIGREKQELASEPQAELRELAMIYEKRGLEKELAMKVAEQLSARDRLERTCATSLGSTRHPSRVQCKRRGSPPPVLRSLPRFRLSLFSSRPRHCASPRSRRFVWGALRLSAPLAVISAARLWAAPRYALPSVAPWQWQ